MADAVAHPPGGTPALVGKAREAKAEQPPHAPLERCLRSPGAAPHVARAC